MRAFTEKAIMLGIAMQSHLTLIAPLLQDGARAPAVVEISALNRLMRRSTRFGILPLFDWHRVENDELLNFVWSFFHVVAPLLVVGDLDGARTVGRDMVVPPRLRLAIFPARGFKCRHAGL